MPDERWMDRAIELARQGRVSPNPRVGAVLVEKAAVLGEGFHEVYGGPHAERNAIDDAIRREGREQFPDATLYCTLEPCCYTDKSKHQPPCTSAILEANIRRVVIAHLDPNPRVRGEGLGLLRKEGVRVETGCRREQAQNLNPGFITRMLTGRPFVRIKLAQSLDGRIASVTGDSRWISDEQARRRVHEMRASSDAVMVGAGTIRADNPSLTVRHIDGPDPRIVIPDPSLSTPPHFNAVKPGTLIFHAPDAPPDRRHLLEERGAELQPLPRSSSSGAGGSAGLALGVLLAELGKRQVNSLLVEGGAGISTALIREGLFDELVLFIAPILVGKGLEGIADLGVRELRDAERLSRVRWEMIGDQILFSGWRKEAVCLQEL